MCNDVNSCVRYSYTDAVIQIQIHMFIADIKVHIQYTIRIFKLKCYNII